MPVRPHRTKFHHSQMGDGIADGWNTTAFHSYELSQHSQSLLQRWSISWENRRLAAGSTPAPLHKTLVDCLDASSTGCQGNCQGKIVKEWARVVDSSDGIVLNP